MSKEQTLNLISYHATHRQKTYFFQNFPEVAPIGKFPDVHFRAPFALYSNAVERRLKNLQISSTYAEFDAIGIDKLNSIFLGFKVVCKTHVKNPRHFSIEVDFVPRCASPQKNRMSTIPEVQMYLSYISTTCLKISP